MLYIYCYNLGHISLQCCTYITAKWHISPCSIAHISVHGCTYLPAILQTFPAMLHISLCNVVHISLQCSHISLQYCTYLPTMLHISPGYAVHVSLQFCTYILAMLHMSSCNTTIMYISPEILHISKNWKKSQGSTLGLSKTLVLVLVLVLMYQLVLVLVLHETWSWLKARPRPRLTNLPLHQSYFRFYYQVFVESKTDTNTFVFCWFFICVSSNCLLSQRL